MAVVGMQESQIPFIDSMKNFSPGLLSFLKTAKSYNRADLFSITPIPQNLLLWSQSLNKAVWTYNTITRPVSATVSAPNGTLTAYALIPVGATDAYIFQNVNLVIGQTYTFSVWLKVPSGTKTINIQLQDNAGSILNITSCNVTTTWQRFSVTRTCAASFTYVYVGGSNSWTTGEVDAWGVQLEWSSILGPYVATQAVPIGPYGPRPPSINACSSTFDIAYQGVTYYGSKFGAWERGKITSEASFDLKANDMTLSVFAPGTLAYPNTSVTMMGAAQLGLFDAALVQVFTAYWPMGQMPNSYIALLGVETKFAGYIKPNGSIGRSKLEFEVADALYLLNQKLPRNIIQASCRHTLYDPNCTMVATNFKSATMTVASGSTRQSINTTATLGQSPPIFTQGYITFLTGQNAGLSFTIKQQVSTTNLLLAASVPLPLAIGDTFTAFFGCAKSQAVCSGTFANLIHFGGQGFVPNPEVAI